MICLPISTLLLSFLLRMEDWLFTLGDWEGMSKWVDPPGYDYEQATTVTLSFGKRDLSTSSTTTSAGTTSTDGSTNNTNNTNSTNTASKNSIAAGVLPTSSVEGEGTTYNQSTPSPFRVHVSILLSVIYIYICMFIYIYLYKEVVFGSGN